MKPILLLAAIALALIIAMAYIAGSSQMEVNDFERGTYLK